MDISNLVNTKVAEFIKLQPNVEPNHLLSGENSKIDKQRSVCHIKLFWLVLFVNLHIYNNSRLQKPKKPLQGYSFYIYE